MQHQRRKGSRQVQSHGKYVTTLLEHPSAQFGKTRVSRSNTALLPTVFGVRRALPSLRTQSSYQSSRPGSVSKPCSQKRGMPTLCAFSFRFCVSTDMPNPTLTPGRRSMLYARAAIPRSLTFAWHHGPGSAHLLGNRGKSRLPLHMT